MSAAKRVAGLKPRPKPPAKAGNAARDALETVGAVIAPATLLTALGLYIGWRRTDSYTQYLGIDETLLQYSAQDYLLRAWQSAGQVVFTLVLGSIIVAGAHLVIKRSERAIPKIARVLAVISVLVLIVMLISLLIPPVDRWLSDVIYDVPYLTVYSITAFSVALLVYSFSLVSGGHARTTTALVMILLFLGVLSSADKWVTLLGEKDAAYMTTTLAQRQGVIVYSKENLHLPAVVTCTELTGPREAYRFRCEGLRLFIRAADKYFLLPTTWSRADSDTEADRMVVLRDDPSLRFEFAPG
ncbi:hypothetical protein SAMN05421504_11177 [Amycolatopsis xylanica]|uniref:Uncharacterized protein n=1 Tax=Amycolatopsis xylanica TaxID=589385 RepID=A0A1H3RG62_9PSEU|nr:hypothetical protein [Amycolatopsis xylanica]SDZ24822.1 hypothetical protein SAMN05421504_11177 [Amycolatopsis xylanica]